METFIAIVVVIGFLSITSQLNRIIELLKARQPTSADKEERRRENLVQRLSNANDEQVGEFLHVEFGLPYDNEWIKEVIETKNKIGTEAAVQLILRREKP